MNTSLGRILFNKDRWVTSLTSTNYENCCYLVHYLCKLWFDCPKGTCHANVTEKFNIHLVITELVLILLTNDQKPNHQETLSWIVYSFVKHATAANWSNMTYTIKEAKYTCLSLHLCHSQSLKAVSPCFLEWCTIGIIHLQKKLKDSPGIVTIKL